MAAKSMQPEPQPGSPASWIRHAKSDLALASLPPLDESDIAGQGPTPTNDTLPVEGNFPLTDEWLGSAKSEGSCTVEI